MWLLIETVMNKPKHRLFSSRDAAIQFLDWLHAESKGNDEFIRVRISEDSGWVSQTPIKYKLEHLRVRDYQRGDDET